MRRLFGGLGARGASGEKPKKPIRANLGDESSFYYDEKLKSWVDRNDKSGAAGGGGGGGDASSLPPPPTSAPPAPAMPTAPPSSTAASSTNGGDGDGSTAPGSNPLSRSNSLSHVRNRYVDVFAGAAASAAVSSGASTPGMTPATGSAANLLAPVLPGSFVPAPAGANGGATSGATAATQSGGAAAAPKFFVPAVPSQSSMTETSAEDDDDDADGGGGGQGSGAHAGGPRGGGGGGGATGGGGRLGLDRLIVPGDDGSTMLRGEGATVSPKAAKGGHHHARGPKLTAIATGGGAREEDADPRNGPSGIGGDALGSSEEASGPFGSPPRRTGHDARDSKSRLGDWAQALGRVSEGMSSPKAAASARVSENFAPDEPAASAFSGGGSGDDAAPRVAPGGFFVPTSGGPGGSTATDDAGASNAGSLLGGDDGLLGEPALLQNSGGGGRGDSVDPNPNPNPKGAAPEELPDVPADLTYSERRERERLARLSGNAGYGVSGGTSTSPVEAPAYGAGAYGGAHRDEYREYGDGYGDGARIGYDAATAEPSLDYQQGYDQQRQQQIQDGDVTWSQDEQGNWWYQYPGQEAAMYVDPSVAATGGGGEGRSEATAAFDDAAGAIPGVDASIDPPRRLASARFYPFPNRRRRRPPSPRAAAATATTARSSLPPSLAARISRRRRRRRPRPRALPQTPKISKPMRTTTARGRKL